MDYLELTGTVKMGKGTLSAPIEIHPAGDLGGATQKTVKLKLALGEGYTVGALRKGTVQIPAAE